MAYVPFQDTDEPVEGCPRITEEEFLSLKEAGEMISTARREFARLNDNILNKYGKKQIEEIREDRTVKSISMIQGHNIITMTPIY